LINDTSETLIPESLRSILTDHYGADGTAMGLFLGFLHPPAASPRFVETLMATARGELGGEWNLRCTVVLMLERCVLFTRQHRCSAEGVLVEIQRRTTVAEPPITLRELQRRLSRLKRIHARIRGLRTAPESLLDFIHAASQPCKLTLGRYLFNPLEIAGRVEAAVRHSQGLPHRTATKQWDACAQTCRARDLGAYENIIADVLTQSGRVYWVGENTPSTINAMCEYPLGTVALVVKPPGSDVEFEIKRAGVRGRHPLSAVFSRNGANVPWSHRLHGGSSGGMLDAEFRASSLFAAVYESVHKTVAPMSAPLGIASVQRVPAWRGTEHLLSYFTERQAFGNGFRFMRREMERCVEAFEGGEPSLELPGALGVTVRFLRHTVPRQAVLARTSSFRLQMLERYLSPDGADFYFRTGQHREYSSSDARRFAEDLLEEILGVVEPASCKESFGEYLDTAFAMPANRARADAAYQSLVRELATYWGTLLAVGGFSYGESFVDRNVGLRSRWTSRGWRAGICFMDHDSLIVGSDGPPNPERMIDGMRMDEWYVYGGDLTLSNPVGDMLALNRIYRPNVETKHGTAKVFQRALTGAFQKTRQALRHNKTTREHFRPEYLKALSDWHRLVARRLAAIQDGRSYDSWAAREQHRLVSVGYTAERAGALAAATEYGRDFFERYAVLYSGSQRRFNRSKAQDSG
jgi:hypothetical protein